MARRILSQWAVWFAWFGLALLLSIAYHLPAAYVQTWFETSPNALWQAHQTQGTVWQGQTHLQVIKPVTPLGKLNWQISPSDLLLGDLAVRGQLHSAQGGLQDDLHDNSPTKDPLQIDLTVPLAMVINPKNADNLAHSLKIDRLNGQIELTQLLNVFKHLNAQGLHLTTTQTLQGAVRGGLLDFKQMAGQVTFINPWPSDWRGQLTVSQLELLGSAMPNIDITPNVQDDKVILTLASTQPNAWQLVGTIELNRRFLKENVPNIHYQIQLTLTGQSPQQMPEWTSFMTLKTPTLAELNLQGVF